MSLICVRSYESVYHKYEGEKFIDFGSEESIMDQFCHLIEEEQSAQTGLLIPFLKNKEVLDYLKVFDIEYVGNFLVRRKENKTTEFVTVLNYTLQLACIALAMKPSVYVTGCSQVMDAEYLKPILKKRNIYWKVDWLDAYNIWNFIEMGCDVIIDDESVTDKYNNREWSDKIHFLNEYFPGYISRELDEKVFDENKVKKNFEPARELFTNRFNGYILGGYCSIEEFLKEYHALGNAIYMENSNPNFDGCYRRHPIYMLWLIAGKWYFQRVLSCVWPNYLEILLETAFSPEELACDIENDSNYKRFDGVKDLDWVFTDGSFDTSVVEKVFALVLNTDEICDAMEYWKYIAFYMKYDRHSNVIEICEKNSAMIEFHRALQESVDFVKGE